MNIKVDNPELLKKYGIYRITNTKNGKSYVGSTSKSFIIRFRQHLVELRNNRHPSNHLQNSWNKYGEECFEFVIVEICEDKKVLLEREKFYIEEYKGYIEGYNENPDPSSSPMFNPNSKLKSSVTHKRQWEELRNSMTDQEYEEYKLKRYASMFGVPPPNKGKKMTEAQIQRMRKPKINGVTQAMKEVHARNAQLIKDREDYILVFDINRNWVNTFWSVQDLVEYSKSEYNTLPIIPPKGKERFGRSLNGCKIATHYKEDTPYKGLYFARAPKSRKLSYANGMNSWKAERPIMSQAEGTPSEGAETTGEVKSS